MLSFLEPQTYCVADVMQPTVCLMDKREDVGRYWFVRTPISQRSPENPAGQRQVPSTQVPPLKQGLVLQGPEWIVLERILLLCGIIDL
jgi:hypothetical protein